MLPSSPAGKAVVPDPLGGGGSTGRVTAAQRLRLVLALGLVNIVLASVALSVGFVGLQSPPTTAGGPHAGDRVRLPGPTRRRPARADRAVIARARDLDTGHRRRRPADRPPSRRRSPRRLARRRAVAGRRAVARRRAVAPRRPQRPAASDAGGDRRTDAARRRAPPTLDARHRRPQPTPDADARPRRKPTAGPRRPDAQATEGRSPRPTTSAGRAQARPRQGARAAQAERSTTRHGHSRQHGGASPHAPRAAQQATVDKSHARPQVRPPIAHRVAARARLPSRAGRRPAPSQAIQEGFPWRRRILGRRSSSSMNRASRGPGTTSPPTCRSPPSPYLHPATLEPIGPGRPRAALPDGAHRPGGLGRARDRDPRTGPRRLPALPAEPALPRASARARARYARPTSTTSTRAAARPAATSRTRRSPRPSTTRKRASSGSRPRPAPASGGVPWPSPAPTSGSRSRSTWSAPATTRSRTAGS